MPESEGDFRQLISEMRDGSQAAARRLVAQYGPHVRAVVRRKLDHRIRPLFDSMDFEQAVWASFLGDFPVVECFEQPAQLIAYLAKIANGKVVDEIRRRRTIKYDITRQRSLNDSQTDFSTSLAVERDMPSQIAIAHEQWERLTQGLPARKRRLLELRREGKTHAEIADELKIDERTVRRTLKELSKTCGFSDDDEVPMP